MEYKRNFTVLILGVMMVLTSSCLSSQTIYQCANKKEYLCMFDNGRGYYVFEKKNDEEATIFFRYKFEGVSDESKISFTLMEVDIIDDKGKEIDTSYFYKIDNSELLVIKGKKYNGYRNNDVVKLKAFAMYHDSNYEEIELIRIERKEDYNRLIPLFPER